MRVAGVSESRGSSSCLPLLGPAAPAGSELGSTVNQRSSTCQNSERYQYRVFVSIVITLRTSSLLLYLPSPDLVPHSRLLGCCTRIAGWLRFPLITFLHRSSCLGVGWRFITFLLRNTFGLRILSLHVGMIWRNARFIDFVALLINQSCTCLVFGFKRRLPFSQQCLNLGFIQQVPILITIFDLFFLSDNLACAELRGDRSCRVIFSAGVDLRRRNSGRSVSEWWWQRSGILSVLSESVLIPCQTMSRLTSLWKVLQSKSQVSKSFTALH